MKKNIFLALALAVGMTACTGDYSDWADPQSTEQGDVADIAMTVDVAGIDTTIIMENQDSDMVQVFVPVKVEGTVTPDYSMILTAEDGTTTSVSVTAEGFASKEDLANAIVTLFGKKQAERTMTAQIVAQTVVDGVTLKSSSEKYTLSILPAVPDLNYWIYGKQNSRNESEKTMPLMPVTKENQTVTTYFSGSLDTRMWSDDTFGDANQAYGAKGGNSTAESNEFAVGGGYICAPSAGWYTLTFNFATYTYTFTALENQNPTEYTSISLIGDFNSWGEDLALTQVAPTKSKWNSHCWYVLGAQLTAGNVKFRANGDWTTNWGTNVNIKDSSYGVGTQNGDNIAVPAGTYDIYFNDITGEFLFIQQ